MKHIEIDIDIREQHKQKKKQLSKGKIFFSFLPFCLGLSAFAMLHIFLSVIILIFMTGIGLLQLARSISCHPFFRFFI